MDKSYKKSWKNYEDYMQKVTNGSVKTDEYCLRSTVAEVLNAIIVEGKCGLGLSQYPRFLEYIPFEIPNMYNKMVAKKIYFGFCNNYGNLDEPRGLFLHITTPFNDNEAIKSLTSLLGNPKHKNLRDFGLAVWEEVLLTLPKHKDLVQLSIAEMQKELVDKIEDSVLLEKVKNSDLKYMN